LLKFFKAKGGKDRRWEGERVGKDRRWEGGKVGRWEIKEGNRIKDKGERTKVKGKD